MELVSVVTIEKSKKCLMENYSLNFDFWASQKNSYELETKYSTVCDLKRKRLATCLPFCQFLVCK